jgi:hypothetical protein
MTRLASPSCVAPFVNAPRSRGQRVGLKCLQPVQLASFTSARLDSINTALDVPSLINRTGALCTDESALRNGTKCQLILEH